MARKPFPFIALAMASLIAALWSGLLRLGWQLPPPGVSVVAGHGPLMVSGFIGTLIGLERAVALKHRWSYGAPFFSAAGALMLMLGNAGVGALLFIPASLILTADYIYIHRFQPTDFTRVMGLGALLWTVGNIIWASGQPIWAAVPWWIGFLLFTIAGERLELSRLRGRPGAWQRHAFTSAVIVCLAGVVLSAHSFSTGMRLMNVGVIALAIWLYRRDIARHTVRQRGLVRFIAVGMLSGYAWLVIGGLLGAMYGGATYGFHYDAQLHAFFLGFVISMIMAHAPIILPAVIGMQIRYTPAFYAHLSLLHAALVLRVAADLGAWMPGRLWGGLLNEVAVILFLFNTVRAVKLRQ